MEVRTVSSGSVESDFVPVKSAERVLRLIELLTEHRNGLSFTQLHDLTGWPRSSLYGLLRTMAERHHLDHDPYRQVYRIGVRVWEAGQTFNWGVEIANLALPYLEETCEKLSETVQLAVLDGVENIYIAKVDASHPLRLDSYVGARIPAYATGIGKVLLAGLSDVDFEARFRDLDLKRFTDTTISTIEELRHVLRRVRAEGFSVDSGEYTVGVTCYAVPIMDAAGEVTAGISTSIPSARVTGGVETRAIEILMGVASRISAKLGYQVRSAV
jgi:IclR family KDG regulon transcriptional repressor